MKNRKRLLTLLILIIYTVGLTGASVHFGLDYRSTAEPVLSENENSIFEGYRPSEIANKVGEVVFEKRYIKRDVESHADLKWFKYSFGGGSGIEIVTRAERYIWSPDSYSFTVYGKNSKIIDFTQGLPNITELIIDTWDKILGKFGYRLDDYHYAVEVQDWGLIGSESWKAEINQKFNDTEILLDTGMVMVISKKDYYMSNINIKRWTKTDLNGLAVYSRASGDMFFSSYIKNISDINETSYGGLFYSHNNSIYHLYRVTHWQETNNKFTLTTPDNVTHFINVQEEWVTHNIYINIKDGDLFIIKHGKSYG